MPRIHLVLKSKSPVRSHLAGPLGTFLPQMSGPRRLLHAPCSPRPANPLEALTPRAAQAAPRTGLGRLVSSAGFLPDKPKTETAQGCGVKRILKKGVETAPTKVSCLGTAYFGIVSVGGGSHIICLGRE